MGEHVTPPEGIGTPPKRLEEGADTAVFDEGIAAAVKRQQAGKLVIGKVELQRREAGAQEQGMAQARADAESAEGAAQSAALKRIEVDMRQTGGEYAKKLREAKRTGAGTPEEIADLQHLGNYRRGQATEAAQGLTGTINIDLAQAVRLVFDEPEKPAAEEPKPGFFKKLFGRGQ